ncbi:MAG: LAGLIDADG family homing endonuclease [Minisyncoccia bacterium]|jgi:intein/homing endonuclease
MDNTVGNPSTNFCNFPQSQEDFYILGLWCADGYHRTSSIGLTNIDRDLITRFRKFLLKIFPKERLKLDMYTDGKRKHTGYKLYVNCRPLLRIFKTFRDATERKLTDTENIKAYFAGRFDGDGCISRDLKKDCRISYGNILDAKLDYELLLQIGMKNSKLYRYRTSNTYVNYISRMDTKVFVEAIIKYSNKLQKLVLGSRRDLAYTAL